VYANNQSLPKSKRNLHIQLYLRRELASKHQQLQSDIRYCHQCFEWVFSDKEWDKHYETHLKVSIPQRCGTITYYHTLVCPGYCPFCLGDESLEASQRLESWSRDHKLWNHINDHLQGCQWPIICRHPSCDTSCDNETSFQFHLIDSHGFSHTRPGQVCSIGFDKASSKELFPAGTDTQRGVPRKRKLVNDEYALTWMSMQSPESARSPKQSRTTSSTVCPSLISRTDTTIDCDLSRPESNENAPAVEHCRFDLDGMWGASAANDIPLDQGWRSKSSPLYGTSSEDNTVGDDSIFPEFIRSPSPSRLSSATIDHDKSLTHSTANDTTNCNLHTPDDHSATYKPLQGDESPSHRQTLRIHLRVGPPKPRITLRVTSPVAKGRSKRRYIRRRVVKV
jgi:hypothetical protein